MKIGSKIRFKDKSGKIIQGVYRGKLLGMIKVKPSNKVATLLILEEDIIKN